MTRQIRAAIATASRFHVLDLARELDARGYAVDFYPYACHRSLAPLALPALAVERFHARMRLHASYAEVIAADGWGNVLIPLLGGLGLLLAPVPEASWRPFNKLARLNRPSYAWVVWIIARK